MTDIEWRTIPGWEGFYEVSEYGQVRTVEHVIVRSNGVAQTVRPRVLAGYLGTDGRRHYELYRDGKRSKTPAHVAVAAAFIGPRPSPDYDVCHRDDDKLNNHYANLRYDTKSENMLDRVRNGIHHHSNRTHCPHGHEYSGFNLIVRQTATGIARACRTCLYARIRAYATRKKATT